MKKQQAIDLAVAALDRINGDQEGGHVDADLILLDFCDNVGAPSVRKAYDRVSDRTGNFWYA